MSRLTIVLAGPKQFVPEGTSPAEDFKSWSNEVIAEKGTRFYENLMDGLIHEDGSPTAEAIRAEEEWGTW